MSSDGSSSDSDTVSMATSDSCIVVSDPSVDMVPIDMELDEPETETEKPSPQLSLIEIPGQETHVQRGMKRRRLGRELWVVGRMTMEGLFHWIMDNEQPQQHPAWSRLTHVFFDGLEIQDGQVKIHPQASKFIPFWHALVREHAHLSIGWSLPPLMEQARKMEHWLQTQPFWSSMVECKLAVKADFMELNLADVLYRDGSIPVGWEDCLVITVPNRLDMLEQVWTWQRLKHLNDRCAKLVINSYGYLKVQRSNNSHGLIELIEPQCESGLQDTLDIMHQITQHVPAHRFLLGIDTQAVQFHLSGSDDKAHVVKMSILSRRQVQHERDLGFTLLKGTHEKRTFKYKEVTDHERQGSLLELRRKQVIISYDSYRIINRKLNMVVDDLWGGVMIGRLDSDLDCRQSHSILYMSYSKLQPLGLVAKVTTLDVLTV